MLRALRSARDKGAFHLIGQGEAELPVENVQEERPLDLLLRREEEEEVSRLRKRGEKNQWRRRESGAEEEEETRIFTRTRESVLHKAEGTRRI